MTTLEIYADFNGLVQGVLDSSRTAVVLDTMGSLSDLSAIGLRLTPGQPLIAWDQSDETEDLEGHGTAQFDSVNHCWVLEFDELGVRYIPAKGRTVAPALLCLACRLDQTEHIKRQGLALGDRCEACGTPLLAAIAPPPSTRTDP